MKKRVVGAAVLVVIGIALPLLVARCMQGDGSDAQSSMRVYDIAPDGQAQPSGAPADGGKAAAQRNNPELADGAADPAPQETPQMPEAVSPATSPGSDRPNANRPGNDRSGNDRLGNDRLDNNGSENTASARESNTQARVEPQPEPAPRADPEPAGAAASQANAPEPAQGPGELRRRESFGGGYVVQVASFGDEANAKRLAEELGAEFKAFYRAGDVNGKTYYRVRVGPFENADSANAAAARLRRAGRATLVRRAE